MRRCSLVLPLTAGATLLMLLNGSTATTLFIWNASASVPTGLYRLERADALTTGELVVVRPPEPLASALVVGGYLPRGVPMLKQVAALPGETICRTTFTITIDSRVVGEARERDGRGRPLPVWQGCRVIGEDDVFLMNPQSAESLDGRYFGPLPVSSVIWRAIPVWTQGK